MTNNRILWIDYAKFLAISGVALVHVAIPAAAKTFIYIFLIPLFFFLSGIFSKQYADYPAFFRKAGLRILIPYLTFNVVTYLFWLFIGRHFGYDQSNTTTFWQPLIGIIYGSGHSIIHYIPLWFLPCIFITENIYFLLNKHAKSLKVKIVLVMSCGILGYLNYRFNPYLLPWGIGSALAMLVFYALGDIAGKKILQQLDNSFKNNIFLFIISTIAVVFMYFWIPVNKQTMVSDNEYGNYFLFFAGAVVGICGVAAFCKLLENICVPLKPLLFIGRNTLIVLGFRLLTMSVIKAVSLFIFGLPLSVFDRTFGAVILAFGSVILCIPIIFIINKYFPWFTGKNIKNEK